MDDKSQEMMISRAKAIAEMKMLGHDVIGEKEIVRDAYQLSAHGNRKERRVFKANQRKRK